MFSQIYPNISDMLDFLRLPYRTLPMDVLPFQSMAGNSHLYYPTNGPTLTNVTPRNAQTTNLHSPVSPPSLAFKTNVSFSSQSRLSPEYLVFPADCCVVKATNPGARSFTKDLKIHLKIVRSFQGCFRGQHFRGQGQWSSRPRPKISRPRWRPLRWRIVKYGQGRY